MFIFHVNSRKNKMAIAHLVCQEKHNRCPLSHRCNHFPFANGDQLWEDPSGRVQPFSILSQPVYI